MKFVICIFLGCFCCSSVFAELRDSEVSPFINSPGDLTMIMALKKKPKKGMFTTKIVDDHAKLIANLQKGIRTITGLDVVVLYTALDQYASQGKPVHTAASGDFDLYVKKKLFQTESIASLIGAHADQKNKYTRIFPDDLNKTFNSVVPTTDGFDVESFNLRDLWWQVTLGSDAIFRIGKISSHTVVNDYAFDDTRFSSTLAI